MSDEKRNTACDYLGELAVAIGKRVDVTHTVRGTINAIRAMCREDARAVALEVVRSREQRGHGADGDPREPVSLGPEAHAVPTCDVQYRDEHKLMRQCDLVTGHHGPHYGGPVHSPQPEPKADVAKPPEPWYLFGVRVVPARIADADRQRADDCERDAAMQNERVAKLEARIREIESAQASAVERGVVAAADWLDEIGGSGSDCAAMLRNFGASRIAATVTGTAAESRRDLSGRACCAALGPRLYYCSRAPGHDGAHAAEEAGGYIYETWDAPVCGDAAGKGGR